MQQVTYNLLTYVENNKIYLPRTVLLLLYNHHKKGQVTWYFYLLAQKWLQTPNMTKIKFKKIAYLIIICCFYFNITQYLKKIVPIVL